MSLRQKRSSGVEAFVSRMLVDKYIYLSKAGTSTVEVWDKRSERLVDCIDCAQIIRYELPSSHTRFSVLDSSICPGCPWQSDILNVPGVVVSSSRRHHSGRRGRQGSEAAPPMEMSSSWARVKALLVQSTMALWVGTRGGYLLLLELSKHQTLQVIGPLCDSIRCISSTLIGGHLT